MRISRTLFTLYLLLAFFSLSCLAENQFQKKCECITEDGEASESDECPDEERVYCSGGWYECNSDGYCKHKGIASAGAWSIFGFICVTISCSLNNAMGVGGGSTYIIIMLLLFKYSPAEAVANAVILMTAGSNVNNFMKLFIQHPLIKTRRITDYGIVSLISPLVLSSLFIGTFMAVCLAKIIPVFLLNLYTMIPLYKTTKTAWRRLQREIAENKNKKLAKQLQQEAKIEAIELQKVDPNEPEPVEDPGKDVQENQPEKHYDLDAPEEPLIKRVYHGFMAAVDVVGEVQSQQFDSKSQHDRSINSHSHHLDPEVANSEAAELVNHGDIDMSPKKPKNENEEALNNNPGERKEESEYQQQSDEPASDMKLSVEYVQKNMKRNKDHFSIYWIKNWLLIYPILALYVMIVFFRGSASRDSIVGIDLCSGWYFGIVFLFWPACFLFAFLGYYYNRWDIMYCIARDKTQEQLKKMNMQQLYSHGRCQVYKLMGVSFFTGIFAPLIGVGGGVIINPVLLELGVHPGVGNASSIGFISATQIGTIIQYYIIGAYTPELLYTFISIGVFGGIVGTTLAYILVKKNYASLLVFLMLSDMVMTVTILTIYIIYNLIVNTSDYIKFYDPCSKS